MDIDPWNKNSYNLLPFLVAENNSKASYLFFKMIIQEE